MKTKIFYVHLFNDFSGSPRVLQDAIEASVLPKEDSYLLCSQHDGFLSDENINYMPYYYFRANNKLLVLFFFLLSQFHLFSILFFLLLKTKLQGNKSIVVVNTLMPFGAGIAGKLLANKVIYYVHETALRPKVLKSFLRSIVSFCASSVVFVSNYLESVERFPGKSYKVIHNGLRSDFKVPQQLDVNAKYEKKQIFFAGSLKTYKGINELVELAKAIANPIKAAINCSEKELQEFKAQIYNFPDNLELIARPNNIQELYNDSFLILNLSRPDEWVETFGLSLLEGMTFGCPAIAPKIGGQTEFVDESCGQLIDSRDLTSLCDFIDKLNKNKALWFGLARSAKLRSSQFSTASYQKSFKLYLQSEIESMK